MLLLVPFLDNHIETPAFRWKYVHFLFKHSMQMWGIFVKKDGITFHTFLESVVLK